MKTQVAYCSACDKDVHIVVTDEPSQDGQANVHDTEIVCLEVGHLCTGSMCPIGATAPVVMAARLVRNGLHTIVQPIVVEDCANCGRPTSQVVIDAAFRTCIACGATKERVPD